MSLYELLYGRHRATRRQSEQSRGMRCRVCDQPIASRVYRDGHFEPRKPGWEFCPYHYPDDLEPEEYEAWKVALDGSEGEP